jgi:Rod binding domain-containing protein
MGNISAAAALSSAFPPLPATPALGKGQKAARDFEAQLIGMVLGPLEKTFAALPGQEAMAGQDDYDYLGIQALSSSLAAAGGFGIARLIAGQFEGTKGGVAAPVSAGDGSAQNP